MARIVWARPQIDAEGEDTVFEGGLGVAQDGEVHEVLLGRLADPLTFGSLDWWVASCSHRGCSPAEALDHGLGVEGLVHVNLRCWALPASRRFTFPTSPPGPWCWLL